MKEAGAVIGHERVIHWHIPSDRSTVSLSDSLSLWDVLWKHRGSVRGFAHSHPGKGKPRPSQMDVTTFAAIEAALGRRLIWWLTSEDTSAEFLWTGPSRHDYGEVPMVSEPKWMMALRLASHFD